MKIRNHFAVLVLALPTMYSWHLKTLIYRRTSLKIFSNTELSGVSASVTDGVATLSGEVKDPASATLQDNGQRDQRSKIIVNNTTVAPLPRPLLLIR